eukprot:TRINITY_DN15367_c0_g1_i1.p1 TRINITY_DN15367_c0_g1~~TRINITY_DN15367_c0_g1_i1.p1  ORF type:complete len:176 (+),score=33.69 TRINITY_DN15367_c0_g1_i1:100-627(+)
MSHKMDVDEPAQNSAINLTTDEDLDIVEGPSEKVASDLGAHVHLFASLTAERPLQSLHEPLLMNLTEDGLNSAIQESMEKFSNFSPMQLAARIRSMQTWAVSLSRDEDLELSRGKKLGIYGKEIEQAVAEAAAQNPLPPASTKKSPVRIMPNTSLSSTIPHSTLPGSVVAVDSTL